MAVMELWRRRDLEGAVKTEYIDGNFFTQDSAGNLVGVKCYKDGAEATLSGSVTGYCILPSGETVSVAGTRNGNQAYILIPQSALAYTGPLGVVIKLVDGNTITTLISVIVVVYRSKTDTVITPSSQIITDWSNQISAALQEVEDASAAQDVKIDEIKSAISDDDDNLIRSVDLKNAFAKTNAAMLGILQMDWEQGTITTSGESTSSDFIRTVENYSVASGTTLGYDISDGYVLRIYKINSPTSCTSLGDCTGTGEKAITENCVIRFRLNQDPSSTTVPSDGVNAVVRINGEGYVDSAIQKVNNDLKSALSEITGNSKIIFFTKKFIALNSATVDVNNMLTPSGDCNCAVVPCTAGDKFTVFAAGGNAARAWGFIAENGSVLSVESAGTSVNGIVLTAPENSAYLVINDNSAPPSYSYIGDGVLIEKVNKITKQFDAYGIRSANQFNKDASDNQNGVYLVTSTGGTMNNSSYTTSGFLDISDIDSLTLCYVHIYCFYDEAMVFIPNSGGSNSSYAARDYIVNVPSTAKYIRISFPTASIDTVQVGQDVTRTNYVAYNEQFVFKKLSQGTPVIIIASDGTGNYTSFTKAIYDTWDSGIDVIVKPGTYDIKAEYVALFGQTIVDEMTDSTDLNGFQFGVRLYNRKIKFESGSHLICDWSTQTVSGSRRFSAIRVDSDVEIDGMDLDVTGAFYAVHDDYGPNALPFTNVYKNCRIVGHSLTNNNCIGGGCKRYSRHILENCYFDNGRTNVTTVRFHNYALNQDAEPVIWVSNCYFNSLFTPRWAGSQTTKMTVYVNNCYAESIYKLAEGSSTNDNVVLIKWNNTETTPRD